MANLTVPNANPSTGMKPSASFSTFEGLGRTQGSSTALSSLGTAKPQSILAKPIPKGKAEVSLSAFSFLFSEFIQYSQQRVNNLTELEKRLSDAGYNVGVRMLELYTYREKNGKRETKHVSMLTFIAYTVWKMLFGKQADLEQSTESDDEYMISEPGPLNVTKFISTPKDYSGLNCASYVAGIVEGILDASQFSARVTAHSVSAGPGKPPKTVILIKFAPEVIARAAEV